MNNSYPNSQNQQINRQQQPIQRGDFRASAPGPAFRRAGEVPKMKSIQDLIVLLKSIQAMNKGWEKDFDRFMAIVSDGIYESLPDEIDNAITELHFDFHYYVSDPVERETEPEYFGEERIVELITEAFVKLRDLGVEIV